jgi:hypothetical protein
MGGWQKTEVAKEADLNCCLDFEIPAVLFFDDLDDLQRYYRGLSSYQVVATNYRKNPP